MRDKVEQAISARDQLRAQLIDRREQLINRLAVNLNGQDLALLGSVGAALAALDDRQTSK